MSGPWPLVKLEKVLTQNKEYVYSLENREYPKLSVQLYGKGCVVRGSAIGSQVKMKRHQLAKAGQVILSEIWGKKGAIGFVPVDGDGALVTSHFFLFDMNSNLIDRNWLGFLIKANYFENDLAAVARGTTGYAAVRPRQFLNLKIPLPPLEQQHSLVNKLTLLDIRIEELSNVLKEMVREANFFILAVSKQIFDKLYRQKKNLFLIEEIADIGVPKGWYPDPVDDQVPFIPMAMVDQETGLHSEFEMRPLEKVQGGKVRFRTPAILLAKITPSTENNKTSLIIDLPTNGGYATTEVFAIHPKTMVEPKYLLFHLRTERIRRELIEQMTGTSGRQRVPTEALKNLKLVLPSKKEQLKIIKHIESAQSRAFALRENMTEYLERVEALFPTILERVFTGKFQPNIPKEVLENMKVLKAEKRRQEEKLLDARRAAEASKREQVSMEKIQVNTSADLTRLLVELIDGGTTRVSAKELRQLSGVADIDTFHAYLKHEYEAGRIIEQREEQEIYLEPNRETENLVD